MSIFNPNCTLPPENTSIVNDPNIRSTSDILFSCVTVLILCTWSVIALNVPGEIYNGQSGRGVAIKKALYQGWLKVKWTLFSLFAPEILLGAAVADLLSARTSEREMREFAAEDDVSWKESHGYLANMGGFVIKFDDVDACLRRQSPLTSDGLADRRDSEKELKDCSDSGDIEQTAEKSAAKTCVPHLQQDEEVHHSSEDDVQFPIPAESTEKTFQSFNIIWAPACVKRKFDDFISLEALQKKAQCGPLGMGPALNWQPDPQNLSTIKQALARLKPMPKEAILPQYLNLAALQGKVWVLDARQLYYARKWGIITLPNAPDEDIQDKNKSDALIKIIAIFQIMYLVVQLIIRRVKGLPITQLEIMTLAFAACSVCTYIISFNKPKDVITPHVLRAQRYPTTSEVLTLANFGPMVWFDVILFQRWATSRTSFWIPNTTCHFIQLAGLGIRWRRYGAFWIGSTMGAIILGSLHALAWKTQFPTEIEQRMWQVASILTIATPFLYMVLGNVVFGALITIAVVMKGRVSTAGTDVNPSTYLIGILMKFPWWTRKILSAYYAVLSLLAFVLYILGRLFVLVEVLRSLAFLPAAAFMA
jgi:hypothetical protein